MQWIEAEGSAISRSGKLGACVSCETSFRVSSGEGLGWTLDTGLGETGKLEWEMPECLGDGIVVGDCLGLLVGSAVSICSTWMCILHLL